MYKLREWIPIEKLTRYGLVHNPLSLQYLEENPHNIHLKYLLHNYYEKFVYLYDKCMNHYDSESDECDSSDSETEFDEKHGLIKENNFYLSMSSSPSVLWHLKKYPEWMDTKELAKNINIPNSMLSYINVKAEEFMFLCSHCKDISFLEKNVEYFTQNCWTMLCSNPHAIKMLEKNLDKIDVYGFYRMSGNPNAISILENQKIEMLDFSLLCDNPNGYCIIEKHEYKLNSYHFHILVQNDQIPVEFIEKHIDKIDSECWLKMGIYSRFFPLIEKNIDRIPERIWYEIIKNKDSYEFFKKYEQRIPMNSLLLNDIISYNYFPISFYEKYIHLIDYECSVELFHKKNMIDFIDKHIDKFDDDCWIYLASNPNAICLIEKYWERIQKINEYELNEFFSMLAENPNAISFIEKNMDRFEYWYELSRNPMGISLLEKNREEIDWNSLSQNPGIFEYDYERMKYHFYSTYGKELVEWIYNPKNENMWQENYWNLNDFDIEI